MDYFNDPKYWGRSTLIPVSCLPSERAATIKVGKEYTAEVTIVILDEPEIDGEKFFVAKKWKFK